MTLILALISAFLPLLTQLIGANNTALAQSGLSALASLIAAWGKNATADTTAALTALQGILTALKADTSLDPTVLAQVAEADNMIQAAIGAVEQVETTGIDLSTFVAPPPVA